MKHRLNVKPLSVNQAWEGKRFKTNLYKQYEKAVVLMLPAVKLPTPPFKLNIEFGFSNKSADIDNPTKPILDIIQKKYGIDDKDIYELNLKKTIVKKKEEFILIEILNLKI